MSQGSVVPVSDEIWSILKEISVSQKETDQQIKRFSSELSTRQKETDQQIKRFSSELSTRQKETDQQIKGFSSELSARQKETDQQIKALSSDLSARQKETDQQIKALSSDLSARQKETDRQLKEYSKRLEQTRKIFETQWGHLVESLIEGKLIELLKARGIEVRQTGSRVEVSYTKKNGALQEKEFDIIAVNGKEVVAVEVKTTLTPEKVNYFLDGLKNFKKYFPDYKSKLVYGAVAYLRSQSDAHLFSQRQGLFVIRATGDSASIINKKDFKPKAFA